MDKLSLSSAVPRHLQRRVKHSLTYLLLFMVLLICVIGIYRGGVRMVELKPEEISLRELPFALTLSLMRMTVSYVACLIFAFTLGLAAARFRAGERVVLPLLDILQSVPVVGFFPAAIGFFIGISHGSRLGVELAASFLIFTSQAWNMSFAVYEAVKAIPADQMDAVASFGVQGSRRFWRLYAPASVPRLTYNSILSWSNGWFFLVACEIIAVGPVKYHLPGIGSFLAQAAEQDQLKLVLWGLLALTALILSLDMLFWRPTSDWAERFKYDQSAGEQSDHQNFSIPHIVITRVSPVFEPAGKLVRALFFPIVWGAREVILPLAWDLPFAIATFAWKVIDRRLIAPSLESWHRLKTKVEWISVAIFWTAASVCVFFSLSYLARWFKPPWPPIAKEIPLAVLASTGRLVIGLLISMAWILPVVFWCWNRPKARRWLNTVAQVGASLPAIALFPLIILLLVRKLGGGMEIASIILLLTGMQWYLLFNCMGGVASIPADIVDATRSFGLKNKALWRYLVSPSIRPALITGAITAWGGGWNALVVSEYVSYKGTVLSVKGIGALLSRSVYQLGDNRSITFCIAAMVGWIVMWNLIFWQPLYKASLERYKFDG